MESVDFPTNWCPLWTINTLSYCLGGLLILTIIPIFWGLWEMKNCILWRLLTQKNRHKLFSRFPGTSSQHESSMKAFAVELWNDLRLGEQLFVSGWQSSDQTDFPNVGSWCQKTAHALNTTSLKGWCGLAAEEKLVKPVRGWPSGNIGVVEHLVIDRAATGCSEHFHNSK